LQETNGVKNIQTEDRKKKLKTKTKEVETKHTQEANWKQDEKQDKGTKEQNKNKEHKGKVRNIIYVSYNSMYLQGIKFSD
jgi:hypothetical protein